MRRDMDLVRKILLRVESDAEGLDPIGLSIEGYSEEQVGYHCYILGQSGLVDVIDTTSMRSTSPSAAIRSLTWAGHDFLDAAREPSRWQQAKDVVEKLGGGSFAIWTSVLTSLVAKNLGL